MKYLVLILSFGCLSIAAAFPESKLLTTPSPTKTSQNVDQRKVAELNGYRHAICMLESIINSGELKPEVVFAALRGIEKNYERIFALGRISPQEQSDFIFKVIKHYEKMSSSSALASGLAAKDQELDLSYVSDAQFEIAKNFERLFDLELGSPEERAGYIIKAIEYYNFVSGKDLSTNDVADSLARAQNKKRNFELKYPHSK